MIYFILFQVSAVTDQPGAPETGTAAGDFDDDGDLVCWVFSIWPQKLFDKLTLLGDNFMKPNYYLTCGFEGP